MATNGVFADDVNSMCEQYERYLLMLCALFYSQVTALKERSRHTN